MNVGASWQPVWFQRFIWTYGTIASTTSFTADRMKL